MYCKVLLFILLLLQKKNKTKKYVRGKCKITDA